MFVFYMQTRLSTINQPLFRKRACARSLTSPHPTSMEDGRPNRPWYEKTAEHEQKLTKYTCEVSSNVDYKGLKGNFIWHR